MYALLLTASALLAAAGASTGEHCVSLDDRIEPLILEPFRETVANSSSDSISFGDWKLGHLGFGVSWKKGDVGNFSSVQLAINKGQSTVEVCTTQNVRRLEMKIFAGFDELKADLNDFEFSLPMFKTESDWAHFSSTGSNVAVTITATQDIATQQCSVSLDELQFNSWGVIELTLNGNDGRNLLAELLFNAKRAKIIEFLSAIGIGNKINTFAQDRLAEALANHSDIVCNMMSSS